MNPDTKLVLDELCKLNKRFDEVESKLDSRFSELDDKWETRLSEHDVAWERRFADLTIAQDACVSALERAAATFDDWRPDIEGTVDMVRLELLVRQFLSIKQTGSVAEYIESFSALVDQLTAYEARSDPLYFTMRFIDGLREEFRFAVMLQRPKDLDTAFVLAQLQDEVIQSSRRREPKKYDYSFQSKLPAGSPLPLPPLPKSDKPKTLVGTNGNRSTSADDRWKSLRAHRRAQGLCQFCAEKWTRGHTCADKIHLHAVQELMEVFQLLDDSDSSSEHGEHQLFLTLSLAAFTGQPSSKSMCLIGEIQGHHVRILVDSGSSHTFVSTAIAEQLSGLKEL